MPTILAYLYAAFAGALTNVQVGADLKLFRGLHNPALPAFVILATGLAVVGVALVLFWAFSGAGFLTGRNWPAFPGGRGPAAHYRG